MKKSIREKCEFCVWFDTCGNNEICEYYSPSGEQDSNETRDYIKDLEERDLLYKELVEEQNN